ncbi:hypothetical protein Tco_0073290 [Tanacetum coccineum]
MKIPMSLDTKLTKDKECELVDSIKYQGMRGSLLYLMTSRPDIMFSVCLYACFQEDPESSYLEAVKLIKEYFAKISLKACFLELKRKNMKNTVLTSICRIHQGRNGVYVLALHKKPRRTKELYVEEMIKLRDLRANMPTRVPYTEEHILALVIKGKQRGHIPGRDRLRLKSGRSPYRDASLRANLMSQLLTQLGS